MASFPDAERHVETLWTMMAIGARYGHQPLSEIGRMTVDNLVRFNEALNKLIEAENKSGQGQTGHLATGGG